MTTVVGIPQTTLFDGFSSSRNEVNLPAGIQAGDVIFFGLVTANDHALGTLPSGVFQIGVTQTAASSDSSMSILCRVADGNEGATFNLGAIYATAESGGVVTWVMRGLNGADLVDAIQQSNQSVIAGGGTVSGPSVTPTGNGKTILQIIGCDPAASAVSGTPDGVATEIFDGKIDTGNFGYVYAQYFGQSTAAAIALDAAIDYGPLNFACISVALNQPASGPTLATVPATAFPGQSRTVTGSGFGPNQGAGGVTINGVAQTVTAWSDTSITFTTIQGGNKFDADLALEVTTDSDQTVSDAIDLIVEPGTGGHVDVVDPAVADSSSLAFGFEAAGGAPVATGDQCHWVYTGNPGDPTSMTVEPDTLVSALDQEGAVNVRFWDATDSTWGSFAALNATVPVVDTVKPVITILGDNPATVVVGNPYTDAGATASDDVDGSLGSVTGVGSVDTNTIGQYTITYPGAGVVDSAGNVADDATRIVNVVAEAPVDPPEDDWPYGLGIRPTAPKTWDWGKRHPKTGARTRLYKRV